MQPDSCVSKVTAAFFGQAVVNLSGFETDRINWIDILLFFILYSRNTATAAELAEASAAILQHCGRDGHGHGFRAQQQQDTVTASCWRLLIELS